jgi:hypothetical protein
MDAETKRLIDKLTKQLTEQLKMIKNHEMRIRHLQHSVLIKKGNK